MRTVILERAPQDIERRKASDPATIVSGAHIYCAGAARALLRFSTYDRFYAADPGPDSEHSLLRSEQAGGRRLEYLSDDAVKRLSPEDEIVILTDRPILDVMAPLRHRLQRRDAPIVGMIHALQGPPVLLIRMLLSGDVHEHDAIMCSTASGRRALENLIESARDKLRRAFGVTLDFNPQLEVIPLGVDTAALDARARRDQARARLGVGTDEVVVLYFGRFSALYKCDLVPLLLAFARLDRRGRQVRLWLAGDDAQERMAERLRHVSGELGIGEALVVTPDPAADDRLDLLAAADVFVSPSDNLQETFGITLAEAMAAGLPIVASDWDGYRELVTEGVTGLLVPTAMPRLPDGFDLFGLQSPLPGLETLAQTTVVDIEALAAALQTLVDSRELRTRLGESARAEACARFEWRVIVRRYEELWATLVERGRHARGLLPPRSALFDHPSYQRAFGHYPTRFLEETDLLALGSAVPHDATALDCLVGTRGGFDAALFRRTIDVVAAEGPMSLRDVLQRTAATDEGRPLAAAHAARLLKYGVLQPVSMPADGGAPLRLAAGRAEAAAFSGAAGRVRARGGAARSNGSATRRRARTE
jgi:glycosyltransferase involved in cell wall biosynthesis